MKTKILFVYPDMMIGGSTTAMLSLMNQMDMKQFSIDVLLYNNDGPLFNEIPRNVSILPQAFVGKTGRQSSILKVIVTVLNGQLVKWGYCLFRYARNHRISPRMALASLSVPSQVFWSRTLKKEYDIAIGFMEFWSDAYVASHKIRARKKIGWIHPDYSSAGFFAEGDYYYLKKLDRIVVVSENNKKNLSSVYPEFAGKIRCIENILPCDMIMRKSKELIDFHKEADHIYIVTICRIDYASKGLDRAIHALTLLKNEKLLKNIKWVIIGDGNDMERLKSDISIAGLNEYILPLGAKVNPYPYLKHMDIFLLPSRYEGRPVVIEEALLLGVPCIVTHYSSASEQVTEGVNGYILNNDEESIYLGLKDILLNRGRIEKIRQGAQNTHCDEEVKYHQFLAMIEE